MKYSPVQIIIFLVVAIIFVWLVAVLLIPLMRGDANAEAMVASVSSFVR